MTEVKGKTYNGSATHWADGTLKHWDQTWVCQWCQKGWWNFQRTEDQGCGCGWEKQRRRSGRR